MILHHELATDARVVSGTMTVAARRWAAFRTGFLALVGMIGLTATFASPALADINVVTDSGISSVDNDPGGTQVKGVSGGADINVTYGDVDHGTINMINGSPVVPPLSFGMAEHMEVTTDDKGNISGGTGTKQIGGDTNYVLINFNITGGSVTASTITIDGSINAVTTVGTGVPTGGSGNYIFTDQLHGSVFSTVSYTSGTTFQNVVNTNGATGYGTLYVTESAVPEPSSMSVVIGCLGCVGAVAVARRRRSSVA